MAAGDVTILQDGGGVGTGNAKMHPYVVALVRWCVSCVWSAATVVVHRFLTTPLPITGSKQHACVKVGRAATQAHIHPEPLVHCEVLRTPDVAPEVDFIFLHGLYGSLENTWRQGDWRSKYKIEPNKVPLRRPHSIPDTCACDDCKCRSKEPYRPTYKNTEECTCIKNKQNKIKNENDYTQNDRNENDTINKNRNENDIIQNLNDNATVYDTDMYITESYDRNENDNIIKKRNENDIIQNPNDNATTVYDKEMFITEGFYSTDLTCVDEYELQARFVQDLFSIENDKCDNENCDFMNKNDNRFDAKNMKYSVSNDKYPDNYSKNYNYIANNKDFIFNNSISKPTEKTVLNSFSNSNFYTTDNTILSKSKNINSTNQSVTIDYVNLNGHSEQNQSEKDSIRNYIDNIKNENDKIENEREKIKNENENDERKNENDILKNENDTLKNENDTLKNENDTLKNENEKDCEVGCGCICDKCYSTCWPKDWLSVDYPNARIISVNYTSDPYLWRPLWVKECKRLRLHERAEQMTEQLINLGVGERPIIWVGHSKGGLFIKQIYAEAYEAYLRTQNHQLNKLRHDEQMSCEPNKDSPLYQPVDSQELESLYLRSRMWAQSEGFMFYSVPHRGSPLANIMCPITARSIELMEISQDCSLVLTLQDRWLLATRPLKPAVRSLVETNRTLMAVLWLRIVSVESADAGIGALCGVSVDHREICKPSSRSCVLYTELLKLVHASLDRWRCINQSQ